VLSKRKQIFGSYCFICFITIFSQTSVAESIIKYNALSTEEAIIIDGDFSEKSWSQAQYSAIFVIHDDGEQGILVTQVKILFDKEALYFAFNVEDNDIVSNYITDQSPLFKQDDVIELFIDPLGKGKPYIELGVSPLNTIYTLKVIDPQSENFKITSLRLNGLKSATKINGSLNNSSDIDTGWQLELRIPFTTISKFIHQPAELISSWRLNMFRIDFSNKLPRQANEYYSWAKVGSFGFHQPNKFGWLILKNK